MKKIKEKFLNLIDMHQGIIHKIVSIYTYQEEERQDLFQEILLQLWKSYPGFKEKSLFSTWMYRVSLNTALQYKRKIRTEQNAMINLKANISNYFQVDANNQVISLYMAIDELGQVDKAIALLYLEQKNYQEIAEIMGMNKSNVGVRINRIKNKLKKILDYEQ